jgi:hypothetical protein
LTEIYSVSRKQFQATADASTFKATKSQKLQNPMERASNRDTNFGRTQMSRKKERKKVKCEHQVVDEE